LRSPRWLALLAGALPVLSFPALNLEWLAWFGLVPGLLVIVRAGTVREGGVRGWWFGTGFLIAALYWMAPEIGPAVILIGAVCGVLWVPYGIAAWKLLRLEPGQTLSWRRALAALVVVPSCWLLLEWIRSWQALGGPWEVLGASQWQHPAILALGAVGGVWLISWALVASNIAITMVLLTRRVCVTAGIGVAVLVALIGAGPLAFALTPPFATVRQATVALVQPGIINNPVARANASESLTAKFSQGGSLGGVRPDLIVWGESSLPDSLFLDKPLLRQIEALSAKDGAEILVNQDATPPGQGHEKWAVLVSANGIKGTYIKTRLVPFGEYIPFRQQLGWLTKISKAASSNMVPGTGAHLLNATDRAGQPLPIGVLICFEVAFPDMARVDAEKGAQLIVYQTETSTFQGTWGPDQAASLGAVRAAETGRPVVQTALTGVSVAFDARGRELVRMGQSDHGVLTVRLDLPAGADRTLYDQWGDYVPWTSIAIVVLWALTGLVRSSAIRRRAGAGGDRTAQYAEGHAVP
jgi:apolipoprotein N-acyltransferase